MLEIQARVFVPYLANLALEHPLPDPTLPSFTIVERIDLQALLLT